MRNVNLDPFWRTSIGFDLLDKSLLLEPEDHYPPFNIATTPLQNLEEWPWKSNRTSWKG